MKNLKVAIYNNNTLLIEGLKKILINDLNINNLIEFTETNELLNLNVDLTIVYDYTSKFKLLPSELKQANKTYPILFITNSKQEETYLALQKFNSLHTISSNIKIESFYSKLLEITNLKRNKVQKNAPKGQKIVAQIQPFTSTFSPREREVIKLAMSGLQSKQIGKILEISPRTVDKHRANSMQKCNAKNIVELISHIQTKNIEL